MKNKNFLQALKFVMFSISAGVVQTAVFALMDIIIPNSSTPDEVAVNYYLAYGIALIASVVWNFTFNRKFTFGSASNVPKAMTLALLFYVPFAPLSLWAGGQLAAIGWNEYLVLGLTMVCNMTLEFVWQKFVVFRDSLHKDEDSIPQQSATEKEQQQ